MQQQSLHSLHYSHAPPDVYSILPFFFLTPFVFACSFLLVFFCTFDFRYFFSCFFRVFFLDSCFHFFTRLCCMQVLFYCHFPDKLLCLRRQTLLRRLYRWQLDTWAPILYFYNIYYRWYTSTWIIHYMLRSFLFFFYTYPAFCFSFQCSINSYGGFFFVRRTTYTPVY